MNTYNILNTLLIIVTIFNIILLIYNVCMLSKQVVRNLHVFMHRCIRKIAMRKYKANYPHVTGHVSKAVGITYTKIDCDDKHSHFILYA